MDFISGSHKMVLLPVTTVLVGARGNENRERKRERERKFDGVEERTAEGRRMERTEGRGTREKETETETEMCRLASRWLRRLLVYSSVQPSRPVQPSDQPVFLFVFLAFRA